jgi:hypothetical protein
MTIRAAASPSIRQARPGDTRCTAHRCRADAEQDAPAPLCHHLRVVFAYVLADERPDLTPERAELPYWSTTAKPTGFVYFVRVGDLVKIGYTADPKRRFAALQPSEVLHLEPGTMQDEKRCHAAFHHIRVEGELFRPDPDLLRFIDDLRSQAA